MNQNTATLLRILVVIWVGAVLVRVLNHVL